MMLQAMSVDLSSMLTILESREPSLVLLVLGTVAKILQVMVYYRLLVEPMRRVVCELFFVILVAL